MCMHQWREASSSYHMIQRREVLSSLLIIFLSKGIEGYFLICVECTGRRQQIPPWRVPNIKDMNQNIQLRWSDVVYTPARIPSDSKVASPECFGRRIGRVADEPINGVQFFKQCQFIVQKAKEYFITFPGKRLKPTINHVLRFVKKKSPRKNSHKPTRFSDNLSGALSIPILYLT